MADSTTAAEAPSTDTAATVTPAPEIAVEAVAPKPEAPAAPVKMTREQSLEILRGSNKLVAQQVDSDPLAEDGFDPLLDLDAEGNRIEVPSDTEEAPEPEPAAPAKEEAAAEVPVTPEVPVETPAEQAEGRKRLNIMRRNEDGSPIYSDRERAILQLSGDEGISLAAAEKRLYGGLTADKTADAEKVDAVKEPTVAELTAQIAEAEGEYEKALESFVNADIIKANRKVQELREQRVEAKQRAREEAQAAQRQTETSAQTFERQQTESMGEAEKVFSPLMEGPHRATLTKAINEAFANGDPVTKSSKWPMRIAAEVALSLGIAPKLAEAAPAKGATKPAEAATPATKPAPKVAPAAPLKRAVPLLSPGNVGGGSPSAAQTISQRIQAAKASNDLPALKLLMREATKLNAAA